MGKRGPSPKKLSDEERAGFLDLIRGGFGVSLACAQLKIHWSQFDKERRRNKAFAAEVAAAERARDEQLVSLRYTHALAGDPDALEFMINRSDRICRFRAERADRRRAAAAAAGGDDGAELPSLAADAEARANQHKAAEPPEGRKP